MSKGFIKNLIPISIIIAGLLIAGAFIYINQGKEITSEKGLSSQEIAEKAINYINQNMLQEDTTASLLSVGEENGVYKIHLKIGEEEYDSYATKDGKFLFPEGYNLETETKTETETEKEGLASQPEASEGEELSPEELETLAKCLSEKGAKFYGAYWCGWCNRQKEGFGEAAQYLPYVECSDEETREMTPECQAAGISSFPTWEFDGEKKPGFKSPEELAELSGCPF